MVLKAAKLMGAFAILVFFAAFGVVTASLPLSSIKKRKLRVVFSHHLAQIMLRLIQVEVKGLSSMNLRGLNTVSHVNSKGVGKLIVANHTSVLDVIILAARSPVVFVTSVEVEKTPILGFLARSEGTVFVERRHRDRLSHDIAKIQEVLSEGFDVVLFPEGTSTDGSQVLRFKAGLFPSAITIGASIEPVCIQYQSIGGEPVTAQNRDLVFYYGDHEIQNHLYHLFTNPKVKVELRNQEEVKTSEEDEAIAVANLCRNHIALNYQPIETNRSYASR